MPSGKSFLQVRVPPLADAGANTCNRWVRALCLQQELAICMMHPRCMHDTLVTHPRTYIRRSKRDSGTAQLGVVAAERAVYLQHSTLGTFLGTFLDTFSTRSRHILDTFSQARRWLTMLASSLARVISNTSSVSSQRRCALLVCSAGAAWECIHLCMRMRMCIVHSSSVFVH